MGLHEVSIGSVSKSQQWLSTAARDSSASAQNRFGFTLWYQSTNFNYFFLFSFSSFIWNHFENIIDVAEVYQRHFLEESEHWLENFNRTHLVQLEHFSFFVVFVRSRIINSWSSPLWSDKFFNKGLLLDNSGLSRQISSKSVSLCLGLYWLRRSRSFSLFKTGELERLGRTR